MMREILLLAEVYQTRNSEGFQFMSSLDKLLISGIRSFNPKDKQTVTFFHPLTLIVGHNGAGKTTIIEALKYACTGEQPLHTSGGKFVCDPKLVGEPEVKGQVKLKFVNVSGREVVCTRSLQVTQTPNSDTIRSKTLESLLLVKDPSSGRTFALSSTCAEINEELPNHLGVSKPILENVIFCHQEESFWPLSEPKVLKTKFDEIFAATRYTKALESLKSIRKKTMAEMGGLKVQVAHDKENTSRAAKHRKQLERLESEADARRKRIDELDGHDGEISRVMNDLHDLMKSDQESNQIRNKIHSYTLEKEMIEKNTEALKANTTIINDSDEELEKKLERFSESVSKQSSDQGTLESQKNKLSRQHENVQKELSDLFGSKGRFEAEYQAHQGRIEERKLIIQDLISKFKFTEFPTYESLPDYKISSFINRLNSEYSQKVVDSKNSKTSFKEREAIINSELQSFRSSLSILQEKKSMTNTQMTQNFKKITDLRKQDQSMNTCVEQLESINEEIAKLQSKLDIEKKNLDCLTNENGNNLLTDQLQNLERQAQSIRDEMSMLSSQGDTRARLGIKKNEKQRKSESREKLLTVIKSDCESLFKKALSPESLLNELEELILRQDIQLKALRDQKTLKATTTVAIDAKLSLIQQSIRSKTDELKSKQEQIKKVCGDKDFSSVYKGAIQSVENLQDQLNQMKSVSLMYNKFILKFQKDKCCSLCSRVFSTPNEEKDFYAQINGVLTMAPRKIEQLESSLGQAKTRVEELAKVQGLWNDCERLSNLEILEMQKSRDALEKEKGSQFNLADDLDAEIALVEAELNHSNTIKHRQMEVSSITKDIEQLDREIASIEIGLGASDADRRLDTVQEEYDSIQLQCKALRMKMDRANSDFKAKNEEISLLESKMRDYWTEKQQIELKIQEKQRLKKTMLDLQSENEKLSNNIREIDMQIGELPNQIETIETNLRTAQAQASIEEDIITKDIQNLSSAISRISEVQKLIDRYTDEEKEKQLEDCRKGISDLESSLKKISEEKNRIISHLDDLSKEVSQIQLTQRNIADNLQLRKFNADRIKLENRIATNKRDLQKYERQDIATQLNTLQSRQEELVSERAEAMGSLRQLEENIKDMGKMLETDFKNIEKQYAENKFKYMVDELAMNDLEKYATALEQAIMTFHSKKMEDINKIIRELWTKTYKGSDIDTIEIRSDPESKKNNRSFNYRVVMITNDVEMDMRGRCSAGQKVIASIIIRLALAETFCLQCGILALDEPTTNLDNENISGLAQALADIITSREKQSNFQLIIITHDEAFVQALGRSEYANSYFRVEKTDGFSTIKQYAIMNDQKE